MRTFVIDCGGASAGLASADHQLLRLDVGGPSCNVNLRIDDITRAMLGNVPDVLLDLLEVAAYVYCADQQASRGSEQLTDLGRDWRRRMQFTIPVRHPGRWASPPVLEALRDVLGFLSDDDYSFTFIEADAQLASREAYFPGLIDGSFVPDEVALFSGGLDSFAGVAEGVAAGKRFALIGHHSASKVVNVQRQLVDGLRQAGHGGNVFYVPVNVTNAGHEAREFTQRTRSFLFACLALVVARMFDRDDFTFFENGVVSLNIPIAADVLGARATRTTHPKVIRGFEEFFSALLERDIEIRTPFQWLTKTEVVRKIGNSGFADLLATTNSCVRTRARRKARPHCGACSQCVDRRFAVLASGLQDFEPADRYELDLLLGDRSFDESLRLAVAYVKFFQGFAGTPKDRLVSEHPQIAAALSYFDELGPDEAAMRAHDLYRRHSEDVLRVIETHTSRHAGQLLRSEIPSGSLLSMCFNRNVIEPPSLPEYDAQAKSFIDSLAAPVCEFAVDAKAKEIRFRGGFSITGSNFKLVETLLPNHRAGKATAEASVPFMHPHDLADTLRIDEASLRQQLTRLRKHVADRLAVDQGIVLSTNDFIENSERAGYRLSPALREVALADLRSSLERMSQD